MEDDQVSNGDTRGLSRSDIWEVATDDSFVVIMTMTGCLPRFQVSDDGVRSRSTSTYS